MITTIVRTASQRDLDAACKYFADRLHVPEGDVPAEYAVAYVCRHFKHGTYEGWEGFVEMLRADR